MRIAFFATTSLAGLPILLVRLLRAKTGWDVRLIHKKPLPYFEQDMVFDVDKDACIECAEKADAIVLENYLHLDSDDFSPINFRKMHEEGKIAIRHFHSEPGLISSKSGQSVAEVVGDALPSIVIAQFQERYYPNALVVPNPLPIRNPEYLPSDESPKWDYVYSPTRLAEAWEDRWNTKGMPETCRMLRRISRKNGFVGRTMYNLPVNEVLDAKRRSRVVIDEMVTGSFHLSGLEGLSMGKPVFSYLDARTSDVLRTISGSDRIPFVNVRLEEAEPIVSHMIANRDVAAEIGASGRAWMEQYWDEDKTIRHYIDLFETLVTHPDRVRRQEALRLDTLERRFAAIAKPDFEYAMRKRNYYTPVTYCVMLVRRAFRWFVYYRLPALKQKTRSFLSATGKSILPPSVYANWRDRYNRITGRDKEE
jgi:hypothetical protein